jgi:hypothetical protein
MNTKETFEDKILLVNINPRKKLAKGHSVKYIQVTQIFKQFSHKHKHKRTFCFETRKRNFLISGE